VPPWPKAVASALASDRPAVDWESERRARQVQLRLPAVDMVEPKATVQPRAAASHRASHITCQKIAGDQIAVSW
jgi:hypothetical protein